VTFGCGIFIRFRFGATCTPTFCVASSGYFLSEVSFLIPRDRGWLLVYRRWLSFVFLKDLRFYLGSQGCVCQDRLNRGSSSSLSNTASNRNFSHADVRVTFCYSPEMFPSLWKAWVASLSLFVWCRDKPHSLHQPPIPRYCRSQVILQDHVTTHWVPQIGWSQRTKSSKTTSTTIANNNDHHNNRNHIKDNNND